MPLPTIDRLTFHHVLTTNHALQVQIPQIPTYLLIRCLIKQLLRDHIIVIIPPQQLIKHLLRNLPRQTILPSHVPPNTHVVFVTALQEHAVRAYEENALDYLLKPIKPERLSKTLERIRKLEDLAVLEENSPGLTFATHAAISLEHIIAVAADGNYSRVYQIGGGNFHVRQPMHQWAIQLAGRGFIQPGRSLLILASAIHHLESRTRDENYLYLTGVAAPLKLGRSIHKRVRELMGL